MSKTKISGVLVAAGLLIAGCGGGEPGPEPDSGEVESPMMEREGMPGMGAGPTGAPGMMGEMAAHMARMEAVRADSLTARLPMHRQMVANMIAQMNREMREMNMGADAAWNATVDSLRDDLIRMPDMDAAGLEEMMPAHQTRVRRLMEMHRTMMEGMGM